ncbi:MAG: universal stress protein [Candidatus Bipolaricaulia bacterium]
MTRILTAVNEDPLRLKVIRTAGEWARRLDAEVTVCHVLPKGRYERLRDELRRQQQEHMVTMPQDIISDAYYEEVYRRWNLPERQFGEEEGHSLAHHVARDIASHLAEYGVEHESRGWVGEPARGIVGLADEIEVDLIVIGFEGLHGLGRVAALGSVSREVLERATRQVLVVPTLHEDADASRET